MIILVRDLAGGIRCWDVTFYFGAGGNCGVCGRDGGLQIMLFGQKKIRIIGQNVGGGRVGKRVSD